MSDLGAHIDRFAIGLGTGHLRDDQSCEKTVRAALKVGYRHIDTARHYGNEQAIGRSIRQSDVSRDDLFLATKVHSQDLRASDVKDSVRKSAERLGVEQIDLVYVHWPAHSYVPEETLAAFDDLVASGKIRHIGLSNFTVDQIETASSILETEISAVQVEMHPFLQQQKLRDWASRAATWLIAHTPLCQGAITSDDTVSKIARQYDATAAQVSLAWLTNHDRIAAVPGGRLTHLQENLDSLSIDLSDEDLRRLDEIKTERRCVDYEFSPW